MAQIEVEQCEEYIKQLKEQSEQDQLRTDNRVCLQRSSAFGYDACFTE